MNVEQLMEALGVNESDLSPSSSEFEMQGKVCFYLLHMIMTGSMVGSVSSTRRFWV